MALNLCCTTLMSFSVSNLFSQLQTRTLIGRVIYTLHHGQFNLCPHENFFENSQTSAGAGLKFIHCSFLSELLGQFGSLHAAKDGKLKRVEIYSTTADFFVVS